jgi:hypothetical protein
LALAGNRVGQDDVEGREAIAGDDQQLVVADGVNVAHLAAAEQRQALDRRFKEGIGHVADPVRKWVVASAKVERWDYRTHPGCHERRVGPRRVLPTGTARRRSP